MLLSDIPEVQSPLRQAIDEAYRQDEAQCVTQLLAVLELNDDMNYRIEQRAGRLVNGVRERRKAQGGLDAFLIEYDLSSEEGIALMCLAEALLRVPDKETVNKLIVDKIANGQWREHKGQSDSFFVNAMTWGLMLTGKMLSPKKADPGKLFSSLSRLLGRSGMPAIRVAVNQMMKIMSQQFVMGETIKAALKRAKETEAMGYRYSYDMLGEAARSEEDAQRYFVAYQQAIESIAKAAKHHDVRVNPGISVKLSALHPRYEATQFERAIKEITPRLLNLAQLAKNANINLTVDAEEAERLDLSLDIIEKVLLDDSLKGWDGFGLAVQSYQKRALPLLDYLSDLAKRSGHRLMVRLIKGAYWDSEIKLSQVGGFSSYPVFTRKASTDVSFLACAQKILANTDVFFPQFATHNAYSLAAILEMTGEYRDFEFQCLHGMGRPLYDQVVGAKNLNIPCRIYAPVGGYEDLLAYLVRRLLENGANTSFVNRISDDDAPINDIVASPVEKVRGYRQKAHPRIPLPRDIYGETRLNSAGIDISHRQQLNDLQQQLQAFASKQWRANAIHTSNKGSKKVISPSLRDDCVGEMTTNDVNDVAIIVEQAQSAFAAWDKKGATKRSKILDKMAELLHEHRAEMFALLMREAGKTLNDAISEVREAIDFCRYYADQARQHLAQPQVMPGPTGEYNALSLHGRGVIACISPWNFPLAIFLGQISAALVSGNCVIAKPAEQTGLIAARAVELFHQAGVPDAVLQLLLGSGRILGQELVSHQQIAGVMFTGSTQTAKSINLSLAKRDGAIVPLIAETGGMNAMIVDSTALPEQVVQDVIQSAFGSAGQRCSALRVLYLQSDIADRVLHLLVGAMQELTLGEPRCFATDIGPVIDQGAQQMLKQHVSDIRGQAQRVFQTKLPSEIADGFYFPPTLIEIDSIKQLSREVFGPVLHVIRYSQRELDQVIADINACGYGLTFGIQSRIEETVENIASRVHVGNCYVNRNMIGAVVGVQAFGGEGLSGTGPKAGGPHYLLRLCTERSITINTTASGGNATLLSLAEED